MMIYKQITEKWVAGVYEIFLGFSFSKSFSFKLLHEEEVWSDGCMVGRWFFQWIANPLVELCFQRSIHYEMETLDRTRHLSLIDVHF